MASEAVTKAAIDREVHEAEGARFGTLRGRERPAAYGDVEAEYLAATDRVGVVDRSSRVFWRVSGRDPARMLDGLLTNRIPEPVTGGEDDVWSGLGAYGAVLEPKGKLISDLRLFRWGGEESEDFLLDLPPAGIEGLRAHFRKFLPPRFARVEELGGAWGALTVLGPGAPELVAGEALDGAVSAEELASLDEDEFRIVAADPGDIRVVGCGTVAAPALDLMAEADALASLWRRFRAAGVRPVGFDVWERLRVEAGRPAYGTDMDDGTIPVEAGIHDRAIDYGKGCYTGQEVIVRIRDRGRVNRHLRGLRLGDIEPPEAGVELFPPEGERAMGRVTSAVRSPRFGETIGLGYARREVEPPARLRLAGPDGRPVEVARLDTAEWAPARS